MLRQSQGITISGVDSGVCIPTMLLGGITELLLLAMLLDVLAFDPAASELELCEL